MNFPETSSTVDFITGYSSGGLPSNDLISVKNNHPDYFGLDAWGIADRQGFGTPAYNAIGLAIHMADLVSNDSLIQSFDVKAEDNPSFWFGYFEWNIEEAYQYVEFALTHLKVTPGRCLVGT